MSQILHFLTQPHVLLAVLAAAGVGLIAINVCSRMNGRIEEED